MEDSLNNDCVHVIADENRYMSFPDSEKKKEEPYDHIKDSAFFYDVTEQFKQQMRLDLTCFVKCEVSTISKVLCVCGTVSSMLLGLKTRSLGINTLGTT